jgi:hypothetical protein
MYLRLMKKIIFFALMLISAASFGQKQLDSVVLSNGSVIRKGDLIKCGIGSTADKSFAYIYTNPGSMAGRINISPSYAGLNLEVKKINHYKTKRNDVVILVVGGGNIVNYWVEIENAIKTGEIEQ